MITIGDLNKIFEDCWIKILTDNEKGEEITIFDQEREKCNTPSFIETLPVYFGAIDDEEENTLKIYLKNEYCEEK